MPRRVKIRRLWRINPKTRVKKSAKVYSRKKAKAKLKKELKENGK